MYVACIEKFPSNVKIMAVILKATVVLKKNKGKKISENDEVDSGKWTEVPKANLITN
jgi:hypothetical protein